MRLLLPELAPPDREIVRVRDPEAGHEAVIDWRDARVRAAYGERVAAWRRATETALRRAQVDWLDVPVPAVADPDAVVLPILRFFRMREQRGEKR